MKIILIAIGVGVIGMVTSLFNMGYFKAHWKLNPLGIVVNLILCLSWVTFIYFCV